MGKGCTFIDPETDRRCILEIVSENFNDTGQPGHFGSHAFMEDNGSLLAADGRPIALWAYAIAMSVSKCQCGRKLPTYFHGAFVCVCGRDYRNGVEPEQLVRRVDELEQRIEKLEKLEKLPAEILASLDREKNPR